MVRTNTSHVVTGKSPVVVARNLSYDHAGRLIQVDHKIDARLSVTLVKNKYNELGQLIQKNLHSENASDFQQQVDYRYNIRGWLTRINDSQLSNVDG